MRIIIDEDCEIQVGNTVITFAEAEKDVDAMEEVLELIDWLDHYERVRTSYFDGSVERARALIDARSMVNKSLANLKEKIQWDTL
jgi:hypothetical protein